MYRLSSWRNSEVGRVRFKKCDSPHSINWSIRLRKALSKERKTVYQSIRANPGAYTEIPRIRIKQAPRCNQSSGIGADKSHVTADESCSDIKIGIGGWTPPRRTDQVNSMSRTCRPEPQDKEAKSGIKLYRIAVECQVHYRLKF